MPNKLIFNGFWKEKRKKEKKKQRKLKVETITFPTPPGNVAFILSFVEQLL
jgi:hypothetical protein